MKGPLRIAQIVVELQDGGYAVVALKQERLNLIVPMLEVLSEGQIKLVAVPGMKMVPVTEALKG